MIPRDHEDVPNFWAQYLLVTGTVVLSIGIGVSIGYMLRQCPACAAAAPCPECPQAAAPAPSYNAAQEQQRVRQLRAQATTVATAWIRENFPTVHEQQVYCAGPFQVDLFRCEVSFVAILPRLGFRPAGYRSPHYESLDCRLNEGCVLHGR